MKYLVDANVLSELTRPKPNIGVVEWLAKHEKEIAVDPIILGEIEYGILMLPEGKNRKLLQAWFADHVRVLTILSFTSETAKEWAQLLARMKKNGTPMQIKDSLIAATALKHDLIMVTRNTQDFEKASIFLLNPFSDPAG